MSVQGNVQHIVGNYGQITQHGNIIRGNVGMFSRGDIHVTSSGVELMSLPTQVKLVLPAIDHLSIEGSGNIRWEHARTKELGVDISGSGNVTLTGETERLDVVITGSGDVRAAEFAADTARLNSSGSGSIHSLVTNSVKARISGSGKIKLFGNPAQRDTNVTGSGKIKFVD